ncbi:YspA, cpYpsA-related SLOG family [compost metagenome]
MRVLVTGGREYNDRQWVWAVLDRVHARRPITLLIQGEATGADAHAKAWAIARGVPMPPSYPYMAAAGRRGGRVRNHRMLRECQPELVLAFPGHTGTAHMIEIARDAGVKVVVAGSRPASLH